MSSMDTKKHELENEILKDSINQGLNRRSTLKSNCSKCLK